MYNAKNYTNYPGKPAHKEERHMKTLLKIALIVAVVIGIIKLLQNFGMIDLDLDSFEDLDKILE